MVGLDDPLFDFRYTLRFMRIANIGELEVPKELHIPFFVGFGDSDELFSVDSCRDLFEEIPSDSKEFHVFPGGNLAEFSEGSWVPLVTWLKKTFNKNGFVIFVLYSTQRDTYLTGVCRFFKT